MCIRMVRFWRSTYEVEMSVSSGFPLTASRETLTNLAGL